MLNKKVPIPVLILIVAATILSFIISLFFMDYKHGALDDIKKYGLCLETKQTPSQMDSCVEFMTQSVPKAFDSNKENPLSHIKVTNEQFIKLYNDIQFDRKIRGFKPLPSLEELTHGKLHSQS
ncbi:hypothetical protein [uncultured Photobacterium sp.]|uniref:hypothetical protein n=1 Tax=uncultured Photobacterium sp. TaxID=173973 RepID=UPI0026324014|nr:hypothetical protein [uncultured Photobacterium sp.]